MIKYANYYLSWCMANLGVVPLVTLAAFLLLPCFLLVAFLLAFVLIVSEPITQLLKSNTNTLVRTPFLQALSPNVKRIIYLLPLTIYISSLATTLRANDLNTIILSRGEQQEINAANIDNFSVGNREIISYKHDPKTKRFLVKGKKIGFSDLIFWRGRKKITHRIYVISKQEQLKIARMGDILKAVGLKIDLRGPLITASGTIESLADYRLIKRLEHDYKKHILLNSKISHSLRNKIIASIYKELFGKTTHEVSCYDEYSSIICNHHKTDVISKMIKSNLKERFFVKFIPLSPATENINYFAKIKIIQMEQLDGEEIDIGLHRLSSSVKDIFNNGIRSLIDNNLILLESKNIDLSTLAEPETILRINSPATIEVGSSIPFKTQATDHRVGTTQWYFAGLKVKLTLKSSSNKLAINYSTEITKPDNQQVNGNKESSSAIIEINKPIKLFQIYFKTSNSIDRSIPFIGKIPLLGRLFSSKSTQNNYKKITGIIVIKKQADQDSNNV